MRLCGWLAATLALFTAAPGHAQPASALADRAETVFVTREGSGTELRGRMLELGPDSLRLLVGTNQVDVPLGQVLRVEVRGDPVKNGAILGAAILGTWCALICGQGVSRASEVVPIVVINTAFGALLGAGIDALHAGRTAVYVKNGPRIAIPSRAAGLAYRYRF